MTPNEGMGAIATNRRVTKCEVLAKWQDFRAKFEAAGRKPNQMAEQEEVLCAFLLVKGAILSDHPLLLRGQTLPHSPGNVSGQFDALDSEDALNAYSDMGKLRRIFELVSGTDADVDEDRAVQGRIYCKTMLEHIRILTDQNESLPIDFRRKDDPIEHRASLHVRTPQLPSTVVPYTFFGSKMVRKR
ncbi:hypothetical protein BT69DRAFT_1294222 [Atractiella rhizophila]|nr:hypothetical protein BT69DRAFT_1294222 [Atractiella rhizophila]